MKCLRGQKQKYSTVSLPGFRHCVSDVGAIGVVGEQNKLD
jgi:hypothetical protein